MDDKTPRFPMRSGMHVFSRKLAGEFDSSRCALVKLSRKRLTARKSEFFGGGGRPRHHVELHFPNASVRR